MKYDFKSYIEYCKKNNLKASQYKNLQEFKKWYVTNAIKEYQKKLEKKQALKELKEIIKKGIDKDMSGNKKITYTVKRVAPSGMSRVIDCYINTKNGFININKYIKIINEETMTQDGHIRIYGCGMDMLFNTSYTLNQKAKYLDNYKGSKKDCYNYIVSTNYNYI